MKLPRTTVILCALFFQSCATTETEITVTAPDGTKTVTKSRITTPDPASVTALGNTAIAFTPRTVVIHPAK